MRAPRLLLLLAVMAATVGAPAVAAEGGPHVFVFSATYGFRHGSIEHGNAVIGELAAVTGAYTVEFSEDIEQFTPDLLERVDVILFNNTTGEMPFTDEQKAQFVDFLECGGGFVGIHAAADTNYEWPEYGELVGAYFTSHPHTGYIETITAADMWVEDQEHRATTPWHGDEKVSMAEEYYKWREDPRGTQDVNVPLSLDETTVFPWIQFTDPYADDQPVAWTKSFRGKNRVFYTNLGHNEFTFDRADWRSHFLGGLTWVGEQRPDDACIRDRRLARSG